MSGESYVLIETLRVDIKRLEERMKTVETILQTQPPSLSPSAQQRLERSIPPSVRVTRGAQAAAPVAPIVPRRSPSPLPPPGAENAAGAPAPAGQGIDLGGLLTGLGRLLSSPDGADRLLKLGADLEHTIVGAIGKAVTEQAPELAQAAAELVGNGVAAAADDLGIGTGQTVAYTQTEQTRDTRV